MPDNIIITGGNGFIGSHIVREFCGRHAKISCIVRRVSDVSSLEGLDCGIIYGDVRDKPSLVKAFKGAGFIIHNAAYSRDWGDYDTYFQTNVQGSINVMEAAYENKINYVLMTGSCSVYGEEDYAGVKDENYGFHSHYPYFLHRIFPSMMNYYRDTKAIAEQKAIDFAVKHNMSLTILEPVWVYGEREFHTGFYEYIKSIKGGMPFIMGSGKNKFHVIYAGDLAAAYYLAYEKKLPGVQKILIGNKEANHMDKIFSLFCTQAGLKKPVMLPKWFFYPIGFILEWIYSLLKLKNPPLLSRSRVNMFYDNIEYSTRKAEEYLGFRNKYTLEEGIKRTVEWYRKEGLI